MRDTPRSMSARMQTPRRSRLRDAMAPSMARSTGCRTRRRWSRRFGPGRRSLRLPPTTKSRPLLDELEDEVDDHDQVDQPGVAGQPVADPRHRFAGTAAEQQVAHYGQGHQEYRRRDQ